MSTQKSILPNGWINGFVGTCVEDIAREYENIIDRNNSATFNYKCLERLKQIYGEQHVSDIAKGLNFVIHNDATNETYAWRFVYNIQNILRPIQEIEKQNNKCFLLISKLQEFGLYKHFDFEKNKIQNNSLIQQKYSIENLERELKEYQSAESDAQKILNDEYVMSQLVSNSKLTGWIVNRTNPEKAYSVNVTNAVLKIIQPEIDRRILERKIDVEARRRMHESQKIQKEIEEKQKFEDAVRNRITQLGGNVSTVDIRL